jgi:hypothetical protein
MGEMSQASAPSGSINLEAQGNEAADNSRQGIGNGWGAVAQRDGTVNMTILKNKAGAGTTQNIGNYSQDPSPLKQ